MSTSRQQPSRTNCKCQRSFGRKCLNLNSFEIDPRHPDNLAFHGGVRGQNEGHSVQGSWPLSRITGTDNSADVLDDFVSSYSTNSLNPTVSQQSASQTPQHNYQNPARSTSIRRRNFRDSVTVPIDEFSQSDESFVRAHRHRFWQIEARLWPNNDSETDIGVTSLTFQLLQFIYRGVGNDFPGATEMIRDSKLRWFHLPMNNVSGHSELLRPMLIGLA
jgi:hypothetical protein